MNEGVQFVVEMIDRWGETYTVQAYSTREQAWNAGILELKNDDEWNSFRIREEKIYV